MAIDWLDSETTEFSGEPITVYPLDKARDRYEVRPLPSDGHLIVDRKNELWIRFAVMAFVCSDGDGKNAKLGCVFHGEGPSGNLRECRHTWWGDNGYLFYPDGRLIAGAFKMLAEFFEEMV